MFYAILTTIHIPLWLETTATLFVNDSSQKRVIHFVYVTSCLFFFLNEPHKKTP